MAVTTYDANNLTAAQQAQLSQYTADWNKANASGDAAGMAAAHSAAEAIRNAAGYTSDAAGNFAGDIDISNPQQLMRWANGISAENTAKSQEMAEKQWQFNADEAQKNRDWQEMMSNTAHQREVKDLIAAGLNPVLSANVGAAVPSGATASGSSGSVDTGNTSLLGNFISSLISSATLINTANLSAEAAKAAAGTNAFASMYSADAYTGMEKYLTENYPNNAWSTFASLVGGTDNLKNMIVDLATAPSAEKGQVLADYLGAGSEHPSGKRKRAGGISKTLKEGIKYTYGNFRKTIGK